MKKLTAITVLVVFSTITTTAQIKNTNVSNVNVQQGIKIKNINKLSVEALSRMKIPVIHTITEQLNKKPLKSWKLVPLKPKDNLLEVNNFHGVFQKNYWGVTSHPFFEGSRISRWEPGLLSLKFRQSKGTEYRLNIKIMGTTHRGKALFVSVDGITGRYPVAQDGYVNVAWRASYSSSNSQINIGHLLPTNYKSSDYRQGFPMTYIEEVAIDKI
jgi:hypothetical protein